MISTSWFYYQPIKKYQNNQVHILIFQKDIQNIFQAFTHMDQMQKKDQAEQCTEHVTEDENNSNNF